MQKVCWEETFFLNRKKMTVNKDEEVDEEVQQSLH